jgi:threonine/homoserine/homoserine lactone efflux protein
VFGIHDLALFIVSGLLLNISPGPDTAYIVARSTQFGWRAGVVAALGIAAGIMVHVSAAALGISAILAASATAFTIVKFIGAGYLIYLGVRMLIGGRSPHDLSAGVHHQCSKPQGRPVLYRVSTSIYRFRSTIKAISVRVSWLDIFC